MPHIEERPHTRREHRALIRNAHIAVTQATATRVTLRRSVDPLDATRQERLASEILNLRYYGRLLRRQLGRLPYSPGLEDAHGAAYRDASLAVQAERHALLKMARTSGIDTTDLPTAEFEALEAQSL